MVLRASVLILCFLIVSIGIVILIMRAPTSSDPSGSLCGKKFEVHLSPPGGDSSPAVGLPCWPLDSLGLFGGTEG